MLYFSVGISDLESRKKMVPHISGLSSPERVGIDVSEDKFDACIRHADTKVKAAFRMSSEGFSDFHKWLKKHDLKNPELWMEATGRYYERLAEWAHKHDWKIVLANPRSVRYFAYSKLKLNKTDPLDASVILRFAETSESGEFHFWQPKTAPQKELRDLQIEIRGLKKQISQEQCRLKCGLRSDFVKDRVRETILFLKNQVEKLHKASMRLIRQDPEMHQLYKCLTSIKGFGDVTIALVIWKIDFKLFKKGRQLVKFAGLDIVMWESGKTCKRKPRISRAGHSDLRAGMYLPAVVAMTHDRDTARFADNLIKNGSSKKQVICAVMARLLRIAFARVREINQESSLLSAA